MKQVIIIRGPLGVGKSTISKMLAKKIAATYYSIDSCLSEHKLDVIPEGEPCIPLKSFIQVNDILLPSIKRDLENNSGVIIDGNFYHKDQLIDLCDKLKEYDSLVITLKAPVEKCIQRDSKRKPPHGKWAAIAVHSLVSKFDAGTVIENLDIERTMNKIISLIRE